MVVLLDSARYEGSAARTGHAVCPWALVGGGLAVYVGAIVGDDLMVYAGVIVGRGDMLYEGVEAYEVMLYEDGASRFVVCEGVVFGVLLYGTELLKDGLYWVGLAVGGSRYCRIGD